MEATKLRRDYKVDILIRGYNNLPLLRRCLRSILENTEPSQFQITYVDNGSSPYDFGQLVNDFPAVQFVRLPFNHGSVRAINIGLSLALMSHSEFILLMDNDTEVPKGDKEWLNRFIGYMADEKVGYAGAVTNYVAGFQHCEVIQDTYTRDWKNEQGEGVREQSDVPLIVSFCMLLRKSAVMRAGLFDERYEPGNLEDYDYSLKLREQGYSGLVAQSVYIHHKGSQTFKDMGFQELLRVNTNKLVDKWGVEKLHTLGVEILSQEQVETLQREAVAA